MTGSSASTVGVEERRRQAPRLLPVWLCLVVGAGTATAGLLPWLVTGLRLPLQNLWAAQTRPEQMPLVLLPFSQYAIILLIGVLVPGGVAAGLLARAVRAHLSRWGAAAVLAGALAVQVLALVQTTRVVRAGLQDRSESLLYLAVLVCVATLSVVVGVLAGILVAGAPPAAAVVGLSVGALALGPWLRGLLVPFGTVDVAPATIALVSALRWVPPVLVGAAVAWSGLRTVGRVAAAVVGLLLVWLVPALTTAISSSAGSRVLAHRPTEMARYAAEVLVAAATTPALVLPPLVVTVLVAGAGILGRGLRARRRGDDRRVEAQP